MFKINIIDQVDRCREVWQQVMPRENLNDIWEIRECFHRHYQRPLHFITAEDSHGICGLLPLVWVEEKNSFAFFPGETWQGKTWLEQNRIIAESEQVLQAMLDKCPSHYHLRYLLPSSATPSSTHIVDEIGYLFLPPQYNFDMENYYRVFSHKSEKRLKKELASFEMRGTGYRYDNFEDYEMMADLNISRYGITSYFYDNRFRSSIRDLATWLNEKGWLRMTTVTIGGEVAAVDMGCMFNGIYTLLAGGTNGDFPGIAKLINTHHMERGCREKLREVDFLCGDFSWKSIFHLSPRPLYLLSNVPVGISRWDNVIMQPVVNTISMKKVGSIAHVS